MAGDPYKKVQAGQPLKIPAETFNSFLDAAVAHKNSQNVAGGARDDQRSSTIIGIRNSSGADRPRGGILGIAGPIIGPSDNFDEFLLRVALEGTAPSLAHVARWAVLLEPLAAGIIGRAVVSGLAICQIVMRHASHQYVEISATGQLESGDSGSAKIVWVADTGGTQWAVINIDSPRTLQAKLELIDDLEEAATATAYLLYQDNLGNWRRVTPNVIVTVNAGDYSVENPPNDDRSASSFSGVKFGGADGSNSGDVVEAVGWIEGTNLRWFAIGAGHKVVTGTNQVDLVKGDVGAVTVELQPVDTREIEIFAKALVDLKAGDPVIAWWNGPLRQWHMAKFIEYDDGCGIFIDREADPPTINVDNLALVGPGLAPAGECGLTVVAGCGIQVGTDVAVKPVDLAGNGLVPAATGCALDVNPGCGIRVIADQVKFEPDDVVGAGLGKVGDCGIDVLRGCGLFIDQNNALAVNLDELVGDGAGGAQYGLIVFPEAGCDRIGVSTGCGIAFHATSGALIVSNGDLAGCGLTTEGECGLAVDPAAVAGAGLVPAGLGCAIQISTGCGIVFGPSNELEIDLRGFDGPGLTAWQNGSTGCWGLQVDCQWIKDNCDLGEVVLGCGLHENLQGELEVANDELAGRGLVIGSGACDIDVALGCGLRFDVNEQVEVDPAALAGNGLVPGTGCQLDVQPGCGIEIAGGAVQVKSGDLAGSGLVPEGTCGLAVNAGCGLQITGDAVAVNPAALAGPGLAVGAGCSLQTALGCGLEFDEFFAVRVKVGCGIVCTPSGEVAVDPLDLESNDIGPTGTRCALQTKGFTGDKQVVVAIECDPDDPYACPVATIETWRFENGLLKEVITEPYPDSEQL